jgi:phosphate transport system protein
MMARNSYRDRLERLRGEVGAMADLTLDRYREAVSVLDSGDPETANRVIESDDELNDWYLDIEGECIDLFALQQPVASDLRFVASSFKIVTDIERVGDLATNLASYGRNAGGDFSEPVEVEPIADRAGEMVADAVDAYTRDDASAARTVAARDEQLDDQCKRASETIVRDLMTTSVEGDRDLEQRLERASRALLTIRDLERVGDHAVNICARTLYMIETDDGLIY